jgi:hypothetical protein
VPSATTNKRSEIELMESIKEFSDEREGEWRQVNAHNFVITHSDTRNESPGKECETAREE